MELIDRSFRPSFWRIAVPLLILLILLILLSALAQTMFPDHQRLTNATGLVVVAHAAASVVLLAASIFTRLDLHSDGGIFEISILLAGLVILKRSASGPSWHAVATPGGSQIDIEGTGSYRIEVVTASEERVCLLGPFLCWLFKIECL